jgi:glycosyltransferase involved in cell wall biosynthesis
MNMHRHLHFVQSTEPLEGGGLGRAALELSAAFGRLPETRSRLVTTQARTETIGNDFTAWPRRGPTKAFMAPAMWTAARELVANADVVHGHGFYVAPNWVFGREARQQSKPLVYHPHGMFEPWILARSKSKKQIAHALFENANFRHAGLWRALTAKEADQVRSQGITAPVTVCPNGIDLTVFDEVPELRRAHVRCKKRRELLFLARLHPKKGLLMLLNAWARLPAGLRGEWEIVIAGPDELGHQAEVAAIAGDLGLNAEVRFTGSVSGKAKLDVLASADAFVLPSFSEGFSVAILEALACRLPVIATHPCNFPDLAVKGGGWCVEVDEESLRKALAEMLTASDEERRERGDSGRRLVEHSYTWPHLAAMLDHACKDHFRL